jgi:predicted dehydrogenase
VTDTINVALIGYAFMGRAHSNAYRQVPAFFSPRLTPKMKVICGRTKDKVDAAARQLGWEESSTDWREVVARPDIGLVDISTSGDSHAEIAIAAAKAGKAVLCEKPLARTLAEAETMLDAVRKAGVPNMLCHNYRRVPAVMLAHNLIAHGLIGQVRHFRGVYLQDWLVDPRAPHSWRLDRARAGAGALGDIGSHVIDLARFLVGEIKEVAATLETFVRERPQADDPARLLPVSVDDASAAVVRFANGAIGTIEATRFAPGRKNFNRFEINGCRGCR